VAEYANARLQQNRLRPIFDLGDMIVGHDMPSICGIATPETMALANNCADAPEDCPPILCG
jgi:hypothetical protein